MTQKKSLKNGFLMVVLAGLLMGSSLAMAYDRDNNPPGPIGGRGTNWENPRGPRGGVGTSPNRHPYWRHRHSCGAHDCDNNPPGPLGGRGTNWENPRGPRGGLGASPN